jgi:hypothetical protein
MTGLGWLLAPWDPAHNIKVHCRHRFPIATPPDSAGQRESLRGETVASFHFASCCHHRCPEQMFLYFGVCSLANLLDRVATARIQTADPMWRRARTHYEKKARSLSSSRDVGELVAR